MAATTTAKKTAKKTAAKATAKKTTKKTAARKTTAKKAAPKRRPRPRAWLHERELRTILEDAGYATAGLVVDVVDLAKELPNRWSTCAPSTGRGTEQAEGRP
jgi:hypothetical protein